MRTVGRMEHLGLPDTSRQVRPDRIPNLITQTGSEKIVEPVEIHYPEFDKSVDGLMFIKPLDGVEREVSTEESLQDWLRQWMEIQRINQRRKKAGQTTLNIPGTLRYFENDGERGILMTDVSERGKKDVFELKYLTMKTFRALLLSSRKDFQSIREQIEKDLVIAEQERILLGGGPSELDSWMLLRDKQSGELTTVIVDIGRDTHIDVSPQAAKDRADKVRNILSTIERDLF